MIRRSEVGEYCKGRQQNYAAARALLPQALESLRFERDKLQEYVSAVLSTLVPFLPGDVSYQVCLVDDCDVAETQTVDDGGQLIFVNRHFLGFLRNFVELVARGVRFGEDGRGMVAYNVDDDEKVQFGNIIGEYLELGSPLTFPPGVKDGLGPEIAVSALEFLLAHEIVHRLEEDTKDFDPELNGFQDYCRLRGLEYRCDRRALALILERRKDLDMPEMAFLGAVCALMAISWVEQFTPGYMPGREGSWEHPGSDSRVLRIHLEEPLFWKASGLEGQPNGLTSAVLRRAFRFLAILEGNPKLIASPLNHLIHRCISAEVLNHDLFESHIGEAFVRGRVERVAQSLGAMWGSSERMAEDERRGRFEVPQGQLACALFEGLNDKLVRSGAAARRIAAAIIQAKDFRLASPEP